MTSHVVHRKHTEMRNSSMNYSSGDVTRQFMILLYSTLYVILFYAFHSHFGWILCLTCTFMFCMCLPSSTVVCEYVTRKLTWFQPCHMTNLPTNQHPPRNNWPLEVCMGVDNGVDLNLNLKYRPRYDFHYLINNSWVRQSKWLRCSVSTQQGRLGWTWFSLDSIFPSIKFSRSPSPAFLFCFHCLPSKCSFHKTKVCASPRGAFSPASTNLYFATFRKQD